ncbi:MAG TPA: multicopper oxidase domain-containing protein [Candidatus Polarisedimenticolaceae bacterium]
MSRILRLAMVAACSASAAFADTATLYPIKDNTLYEPIQQDAFADKSDGAGPTMFTGRTKDALNQAGQAAVRRAVLEFDVAGAIPAGATIQSVQLTMYCDKVKANTGFNVTLHRLSAEWGEGTSNTGNSQQGRGEPATTNDATWRHTFYPNAFWTTPGGDYAGTASATRSVGAVGSYTWGSTSGMVADVQLWLNTPSQNHGWLVKGLETQTETAKRFGTRENATTTSRPRLVIDYTPATVSGACCEGSTCSIRTSAGCAAVSGTYQGDGTSCSPNPCVVASGACCAASGLCSVETQAACQGAGGTYRGDGSTCGAVECSIVLTPFLDPLPRPAVATPTSGQPGGAAGYTLTMKEVQQTLHSQLPATTVWGFDDGTHGPGYPGPTIEARRDQLVTVNWVNDLRVGGTGPLRTTHYLAVDQDCIMGAENTAKTVFHLHGAHVREQYDGYPELTFLPGFDATYEYENHQQAGYLWYHDHALGITRLNVYMGLAGLYLLRDSVEDAVNLPVGEYEVPLVIQDRKFNPDGTLSYPSEWMDHFFGDKALVNGKVWPYLDVKRGKYRFRLLNGSGSRVYTLSLAPPTGTLNFTVIGTEGGLLEAPVHGVGQLTIGPGERYDVVVDFAAYANGTEILLTNSAAAPFPNGTPSLPQIMKFRVGSLAGDTDPLPATLRPIARLQPAEAVRSRDFRLKTMTDGCGNSKWAINDLGWEDITEYPELGTVEIWRFINDSGVSHPMHMHLVNFQVLDRDGFTKGAGGEIIPNGNPQAPPAEENGWKDTAMVAPNEILRVIAKFESYKGRYAYHCHILEHEDHEMMRQFQTIQCGDAVLDPTEECDDGEKTSLNGCDASCDAEEFVTLSGTAAGGSVSVTVGGEVVTVTTTPGQTAEQVASALAAAINADPELQAAGVAATAVGRRVVTNGDVTNVTLADAGLDEVLDLRVEKTRLWWGTIGGATSYDVVRGRLDLLRAGGGNFADPFVTEACLANDRASTFWEHTENPATGQSIWYLVRSQPGGTYDSGAPTQSGSRDAEIAASGQGCP